MNVIIISHSRSFLALNTEVQVAVQLLVPRPIEAACVEPKRSHDSLQTLNFITLLLQSSYFQSPQLGGTGKTL